MDGFKRLGEVRRRGIFPSVSSLWRFFRAEKQQSISSWAGDFRLLLRFPSAVFSRRVTPLKRGSLWLTLLTGLSGFLGLIRCSGVVFFGVFNNSVARCKLLAANNSASLDGTEVWLEPTLSSPLWFTRKKMQCIFRMWYKIFSKPAWSILTLDRKHPFTALPVWKKKHAR